MTEPIVSVLLPVYNCELYLGAAIQSILSQTFADYELIIIDDGSTDSSASVVDRFHDSRIHFIQQNNQGLASTLNRGICLARGRYIARQDADDLSYPNRFALQVDYMERHPRCALLGTWAQIMEGETLSERFHRHPTAASELRYQLLFNNPFVHSSVMIRRSVLDKVGVYSTDPERQPPEDYELWSRIAREHDIANIPRILQVYREIPGSLSRVGPSPFRRSLIKICAENISTAAGLPADDKDVIALAAIVHGGAKDLVQKPDFDRLHAILLTAITHIADSSDSARFHRDSSNLILSIRASWLARESPAYGLLHKAGPLRNIAKRLWRLSCQLRSVTMGNRHKHVSSLGRGAK